MTYPDDVLKAAREAAATDEENRAEAEKAAGNLAGHSWRSERARGYRNGKYDSEEKVTAACIAIMAERQRCASLCIDLRHPNYSSETEDWIAGTEACAVAILGQQEAVHV